MRTPILIAAVALLLPGLAAAQDSGLSQPVIALTASLAKNADTLKLDAEQKSALKSWLDTMPARRKALEDETVALRAEMRAAIVAGAPVADREALAKRIGENESALIMMRSNCVDHWRAILSPEQFSALLILSGVN